MSEGKKPTKKPTDPRKRLKLGATPSSTQPTQTPTFDDDRARARYEALTKAEFTYYERGFDFSDGWEGYADLKKKIEDTIKTLGWANFCKAPANGSRELVIEFNANGQGASQHMREVNVRGMRVSFRSYRVDEVLGIVTKGNPTCHYSEVDSAKNYEEVCECLCGQAGMWTTGVQGQPTSIKRQHLTLEAKVWLHFICSRIIPTQHPSEVTWDRGVLLYCILKGKYVDVGEIISREILQNLNKKGAVSKLIFPNLISALCVRAGVRKDPNEPLVPSKPNENISKYFLDRTVKGTSRSKPSTSRPSRTSTSRPLSDSQLADYHQFMMCVATAHLQIEAKKCQHQGIDLSNVRFLSLPPWFDYSTLNFNEFAGSSGRGEEGEEGAAAEKGPSGGGEHEEEQGGDPMDD